MRKALMFAVLAMATTGTTGAFAQTTPVPAATPAPAAKPAVAKYTTADTEIGTLLDDPAAKAVIDKHLPEFTSNEQIDMARSLTFRSIQQYTPDILTDKKLADIDADLGKIPAKPTN